jgi:hypothetical protein
VRYAVSLKEVLDDRAVVVVQSVEDVALQLLSASTAQGCAPLNEATSMRPASSHHIIESLVTMH